MNYTIISHQWINYTYLIFLTYTVWTKNFKKSLNLSLDIFMICYKDTYQQLQVTMKSIYLWLYSSLLGLGSFFSYLIFSTGLRGRAISPSQGRYFHTGEHKHRINAHRHSCLKWDSNPRSQRLSGWRRFMRGHCDRREWNLQHLIFQKTTLSVCDHYSSYWSLFMSPLWPLANIRTPQSLSELM
jgi:hypothetical protein